MKWPFFEQLFFKQKLVKQPIQESVLTLRVKITFNTSFQVKYRSTEGHNKIKEFSGNTCEIQTLPSRDIAVFVNNNTLLKNQQITLELYKDNELLKSKSFDIPSNTYFTPWLNIHQP